MWQKEALFLVLGIADYSRRECEYVRDVHQNGSIMFYHVYTQWILKERFGGDQDACPWDALWSPKKSLFRCVINSFNPNEMCYKQEVEFLKVASLQQMVEDCWRWEIGGFDCSSSHQSRRPDDKFWILYHMVLVRFCWFRSLEATAKHGVLFCSCPIWLRMKTSDSSWATFPTKKHGAVLCSFSASIQGWWNWGALMTSWIFWKQAKRQ